MRAKDRINLNIFVVALFIVCQMTQCIALFVKKEEKGFHNIPQKPNISNIGNQCHKNADHKFEEANKIIPYQIDENETLKEQQMKYLEIA